MLTASPVRKPIKPPPLPKPAPDFLTPDTARVASKESSLDLDQLLENAGLQGILEKDFVLMMGLKHDLNQKLEKLSTNMHQIAGPVSLGAPYLALTLHQPAAVEPVDERQEQYRDIMRLFPSSVSTASSPRSRSGSRADSRRTKSTGSGLIQRSSCSK
ncbi:uncharacterized protein LOC125490865 [Plutella xylostella]|uniref:uncharacterized protein LOC125490865 n=1 Tax=Plutella xylostella TaxID=51655 RepID=UPI0020323F27|nr:uncharacterized protein LOC125490865 [Plutella xylostella]